jgi:NRAMP (natural resistance-associated macrophage protein)-like metal ion transporter
MARSCVEERPDVGRSRASGHQASSGAELAKGAPRSRFRLLEALGPGLITGASDDDPSGIATYSQAGAQFGYGLGWTLVLTYPLMAAVQEISARLGRVTGKGIAGNIRQCYPGWVLNPIVALIVLANTINLGADLGAMGAAVRLLVGGPSLVYVAVIGIVSVLLEVFISYSRYISVLKWFTLALFAYVATAFVADVPWGEVLHQLVLPPMILSKDYVVTMVAILGTTISPYLFFWQAEQEVEDQQEKSGAEPLIDAPRQAKAEIRRIELDTYIGMAFSNGVALFILVTAAATLHAHGITHIQTSAQAAEALRPIAGEFAFVVFAAGIVGTGLLALPVLAGSAAYALGETRGWPVGLARLFPQAKAFYLTIAAATLIGVALNLTPIDPIAALVWSAVINGVVAVPVMVLMMLLGSRRDVMGRFTLPLTLRVLGWATTGAMAAATLVMIGSFVA